MSNRAFSHRGSHSSMGSNVFTTINQGGGDKKAGFAYQVGKTSASGIRLRSTPFLNATSSNVSGPGQPIRCCTRDQVMTVNPWQTNVSISRNVISSVAANRYFRFVGPR